MLQVGQRIERQFVSKNMALFRLWHSHLCDATLRSKVGHFLEDSKTDERREITAGMSEYHITHWN
jgi:hypothetical protein